MRVFRSIVGESRRSHQKKRKEPQVNALRSGQFRKTKSEGTKEQVDVYLLRLLDDQPTKLSVILECLQTTSGKTEIPNWLADLIGRRLVKLQEQELVKFTGPNPRSGGWVRVQPSTNSPEGDDE